MEGASCGEYVAYDKVRVIFTGMIGYVKHVSIESRPGTSVRAQRQQAVAHDLLGRMQRPLPARRGRHHADVLPLRETARRPASTTAVG